MPIDPEFTTKVMKHGQHNGHDVWGEVKPPEKLGIHGTTVAVDHDLCDGDATCAQVCPVNVFEMIDSPGHPTSNKKSDPVRESDCIYCMACETQCPPKAIKITQK
jgi:NAD-dependent dihydropyrimidine dehydrogenase PreA subunit